MHVSLNANELLLRPLSMRGWSLYSDSDILPKSKQNKTFHEIKQSKALK